MSSRSSLVLMSMLALGATAAAAVLLWPTSAEPDGSPRSPGHTQPVADSSAMHAAPMDGPGRAFAPDVQPHPSQSAGREAVAPSFSGIVLDHERRPIEGARVAVRAALRIGDAPTELASVASGADGRFEISYQPGWPNHCTVGAATEASWSVDLALRRRMRPRKSVELVLSPPATLTRCTLQGTILDATTGVPLPEATVLVGDLASTSTDANGHFEIRASGRNGSASILVKAEGYAPEFVSIDVDDGGRHDSDIALRPLREIEVQLVDSLTRTPIPAARFTDRRWATTTADSSGWCRIRVPLGGRGWFTVRADGYCGIVWSWQQGDIVADNVYLPLERAVTISGRVVDGDGTSLPSCEVELCVGDEHAADLADLVYDGVPGRIVLGSLVGRTVTDDRGHFDLSAWPPGEPCVVVAKSDTRFECVPAISSLMDLGAGADLDVGTLVLVEGGLISGVVERNGAPFQGIAAWYRVGGRVGASCSISGDGTYELSPVSPGRQVVCVLEHGNDEPVAHGVVVVAAGRASALDVRFGQQTSTITGQVTDAQGWPLRGIQVEAASDDVGATPHAGAVTDEHGRYTIVVRSAGHYDVRARHGSIRRLYRGVEPGAQNIDFAAIQSGPLRLRLIDADTGQPVDVDAGRKVHAAVRWRKASEGPWWRAADLHGLGAGLAQAEVPAGRLDLEICLQRLGYQAATLSCRIDQPELSLGTPIEVRLERGVELRAVINDAAGLRAAMGERRLFVVREGQSIRGPLDPGAGNVWVGPHDYLVSSPSIWHAQLLMAHGQGVTLRGLTPGRYSFIVLPAGGATLDPAGFLLGDDNREVQLDWQRL